MPGRGSRHAARGAAHQRRPDRARRGRHVPARGARRGRDRRAHPGHQLGHRGLPVQGRAGAPRPGPGAGARRRFRARAAHGPRGHRLRGRRAGQRRCRWARHRGRRRVPHRAERGGRGAWLAGPRRAPRRVHRRHPPGDVPRRRPDRGDPHRFHGLFVLGRWSDPRSHQPQPRAHAGSGLLGRHPLDGRQPPPHRAGARRERVRRARLDRRAEEVPLAVGDSVRISARERPVRFIEPRGAPSFWDLLRRKVELLPR